MARVALVVPSSNTTMEVDFYRGLPGEVTLHTARMRLVEATAEEEAAMLDDHLPGAIGDLATVAPDVVVFGCTSGGALRGNAYEEDLVARMAAETGAEAISVSAAVRAALRRRGASRVAVVTPYVEELNDAIRASLEDDGFAVAAIHGLGLRANAEIGAVEPAAVVDLARERLAGVEADAVFASCTNLRAAEARPEIEAALGLPAVTSNHAALEATLERLGAGAAP